MNNPPLTTRIISVSTTIICMILLVCIALLLRNESDYGKYQIIAMLSGAILLLRYLRRYILKPYIQPAGRKNHAMD